MIQRILPINCSQLVAAVAAMAIISFAGSCKVPDPLAEVGPASFGALYAATGGNFHDGYFVFNAPGGRNYLAINADFQKADNVLVGLDLSEFMQAGFDPQLLKAGDFGPDYFVYDLPTSSMVLSRHIDAPAFKAMTAPTVNQLYSEILRSKPGLINYQPAGKRFSIDFGFGVGLDWPAIPVGSQQDVALLIDAAPFLKTGLKAERLQKWKLENLVLTAADGKITTISRLRLAFRLP